MNDVSVYASNPANLYSSNFQDRLHPEQPSLQSIILFQSVIVLQVVFLTIATTGLQWSVGRGSQIYPLVVSNPQAMLLIRLIFCLL